MGGSVGKVEEALEGEGVGTGIARQNEKKNFIKMLIIINWKKKNKRKGV